MKSLLPACSVSLLLLVALMTAPLVAAQQPDASAPQGPATSLSSLDMTAQNQPRPEGQGGLTLSDVIVMALRNNLNLRSAAYDPRMAEQTISQALSEFDPTFSASGTFASTRTPSFVESTEESAEEETVAPISATIVKGRQRRYQLGLVTKALSGGSISLSVSNTRAHTNSTFVSNVSPYYETQVALELLQPLLKNAGAYYNTSGIAIARNNFRVSIYEFEESVMSTVLNVIGAYWDLVFTREDLKAKQTSLEAAKDFLRNNEIMYRAGAVPKIEVTRAQARKADREEAIVQARASVKDAEDRLRRILGPNAISLLSVEEMVPTDTPTVHAEELDLARSVNYALSSRPDIRRLRVLLESYDILLARTRNQLLPQVDLSATYRVNGLGSDWDNDWHMVGTLDQRDIEAGLSLRVPIGNRKARATYTHTHYERQRAIANYAIAERNVILAVKKAIRDVATNLQSVETNRVRVQASAEQLKAEIDKFNEGQKVGLDVLDAQDALQQAQSALIESVVAFNKAMATYYRDTGAILEQYNIHVVAPAEIRQDSETLLP